MSIMLPNEQRIQQFLRGYIGKITPLQVQQISGFVVTLFAEHSQSIEQQYEVRIRHLEQRLQELERRVP